jgi:osmotically-inducible protein OsmY
VTTPPTTRDIDTVTERWRAATALDATGLVAALQLDGHLVLRGDAGSHADRTLALEIAEGVAGTGTVRNEITVRRLRLGADDSDTTVTVRAEESLQDAAGEHRVTVSVVDHVATLRGDVGDVATRIACHAAVARTEGVHFVDDRTTVDGPVPQ